MRRKKESYILYTGTSGFPFGSAAIQRQLQLSKVILEGGFKVLVINRNGTHSKRICDRENIRSYGNFEGIRYIYSSYFSFRPSIFILRNMSKIIGRISEIFIIIYFRLFKNAKYIINNSITLIELKYYYFISRFLHMDLVYDYVEIVSSIGNRTSKELIIKSTDFDFQFYRYVKKLIVISHFIENHIKTITPNTPLIRIPPIIDFSFIDSIEPKIFKGRFYLFCGSAAYSDIIAFVIKAFNQSISSRKGCRLKLIINGTATQLAVIEKLKSITECKKQIDIICNLTYIDLIGHYKSAEALLIPISNILQDQARFPFKICEYTASKRPIITSDSGVISYYFTNNHDAFIAKTDDIADFANKMNLAYSKPKLANKVGHNAYKLAFKHFNYKTYVDLLKKILNN